MRFPCATGGERAGSPNGLPTRPNCFGRTSLSVVAEMIAAQYFLLPPVAVESPAGVAVDATGSLFIADTGHHRILKVDMETG